MQFYDKLASFVGTRTSPQCRSHHQKLFDKFKYVSRIIDTFKTEVGVDYYKQRLAAAIKLLSAP